LSSGLLISIPGRNFVAARLCNLAIICLTPDNCDKTSSVSSTVRTTADKIYKWLDTNDEKIGTQGKPIKSNIIDNESTMVFPIRTY